jgi:hypothetical protein
MAGSGWRWVLAVVVVLASIAPQFRPGNGTTDPDIPRREAQQPSGGCPTSSLACISPFLVFVQSWLQAQFVDRSHGISEGKNVSQYTYTLRLLSASAVQNILPPRMLRWFPRDQIAIACFSRSPRD